MPIFMIERTYADRLDPTDEDIRALNEVNDEEEVRWILSFLSPDRRKSYCLYEAESPEAIRRAAERAGLPADVIMEMGEMIRPDGSRSPIAL